MIDVIQDYISKSDWRVKENSNTNYSFTGLQGHVVQNATAKYCLEEMYKGEIADAHKQNFMYIHDLGYGITAYCSGWSCEDFFIKGYNKDHRFLHSNPPKHFDIALNQLVNLIFIFANEWAGAQAINSIDVFLAPFIREDKLTYKQVKKEVESFVFNLNNKNRIALQSPFSNITCDLTVPKDLKNRNVIVGGKELDYTYSDCQKEIDMFNKAFIEAMKNGDGMGKPFAFPIPTYNITKNFDWESEIGTMIVDLANTTGVPYFANFVNSDMDPSDVRSLCCRLRLDTRELEKNSSGLFGSGDKTGSIGVVTLNLPRIGYMSKKIAFCNTKFESILKHFPILQRKLDEIRYQEIESEEKMTKLFFTFIDYFMYLAKKSLVIKRKKVEELYKLDFFPYTKRYLDGYRNYFNTLGINGGNECVLNMFGKNIEDKDSKLFLEKTLTYMLEKLKDFQEEYKDYYGDKGLLFNLEATPSEGSGSKLAIHDLKTFKDIITANGHNQQYYTNSTQLPQDSTTNIFEALDHQDSLQTKYTSGTVFHIYLEESISNLDTAKSLLKKVLENYKLPYFSLSPNMRVCPIHGVIQGNYEYCPFEHTDEEIEYLKEKGVVYEDEEGDKVVSL